MKNIDQWRPSKFVFKNGKLRASRNPSEVQISSRFVVDIVASHYQQYLPKYASGKLIDLGCGKVPLYEAYKDFIESNFCVDWENTNHKKQFLDVVCDLNKPLPFVDGTFDTILLSDVLEHLHEPGDLWREMSRILRSEGKLILNVPFFYKIHESPHDYYRYTEFALKRFAEKSGFVIKVMEPIGGVPEILTDIMSKTSMLIPMIGKTLAKVMQTLGHLFIRTKLGNKISRKTKILFPLGYFIVAEKALRNHDYANNS